MKKPVAAFIAGRTAPPGSDGPRRAIISRRKGTAAEKIAALEDAGHQGRGRRLPRWAPR